MLLHNFFQNAYVTRDLKHAQALLGERHNVTKWVEFEPEMEVFTALGGWGPCHLKVGLAWVGALQIELIEPISGNMEHYLDYLPADPSDKSPRLHHICSRVPDWDAARKEVTAKGWPVAYEGGVDGCSFVYLDTRESLGHYLEYLWMSDELWAYSGGT